MKEGVLGMNYIWGNRSDRELWIWPMERCTRLFHLGADDLKRELNCLINRLLLIGFNSF